MFIFATYFEIFLKTQYTKTFKNFNGKSQARFTEPHIFRELLTLVNYQ